MYKRIWIVLVVALALLPSSLSAQPSSAKEKGRNKIDSALIKVMESVAAQQGNAIQTARALGVPFDGNSVTITLVLNARAFGASVTQVSNGVRQVFGSNSVIQSQSRTLIRLKVPLAMLPLIELLTQVVPAIGYIRPPLAPQTLAVSEGVALIGATAFHNSGNLGQGAKVAVIDLGFSGLSTAQARGELPANAITRDFSGTGVEFGTSHGTAVAEIVRDVAPNAQLYLYKISDEVDLENAVAEAIAQGVKIINHSVGWFNTSYYDGTGVIADVVQTALSAGILWVNSAGNYARRHYKGVFRDSNANGWDEFAGSDETIDIQANAGETIRLYLTWRDWPLTAQDYDLVLVNAQGSTVAISDKTQNGGQEPTEALSFFVPSSGIYRAKVQAFSGNAPKELTLFSLFHDIEYAAPQSSIVTPADVNGVLSVAAIRQETWQSGVAAGYSSQGPTNDGRAKPDISGPDNVQTSTMGGFEGTSAAAPHVAGAAALLLSQNPSMSGLQLGAQLRASAIPSGSPLATGAGRLSLSAPPPSGRADLLISLTDFAPRNPTIGDSLQHTITVRNQGDGSAGAFVVRFQDGGGSDQQTVTGLVAGASASLTFVRTLRTASDVVTVTVDAANQVSESNENNNTAQYTVVGQAPPPVGQPDLVVELLAADPGQPVQGSSFQLRFVVRNRGNGAAGPFRVEIQGGPAPLSQALSGLGAGAGVQLSATTQLSASRQTYTVTVDASNQVSESDEGNNTQSLTVETATPPPSNAPRGEVHTDKASYQLGESLQIFFSNDQRAYAALYSVDAAGRVSQVFPNAFSQNNLMGAGNHTLPDGNYRFTVTGPVGSESLHLLLSLSPANLGLDGQQSGRYLDPEQFSRDLQARAAAQLGSGQWSTTYTTFQVGGAQPPPPQANQPPRAAFTFSPSSPLAGQDVSFDASSSSDPDGQIVEYRWDFDGNGTTDATGLRVATRFPGSGSFEVRLAVVDNNGASATAAQTVQVRSVHVNQPPQPRFSFSPSTPQQGETVVFDASASTDVDGIIVDYRWDLNGDGVIDVQGVRVAARFNTVRDYPATLTVVDNNGAAASTTQTVRVGQPPANQPPVASFTFAPSAPQTGQTVTFDAGGSRDPDGSIANYLWDFDGNGSTDATGQQAQWRFGAAGGYRVTLTVVDNGGLAHTVQQTVPVSPGGVPAPSSDPIPSDQPGIYLIAENGSELRIVIQGQSGWVQPRSYWLQFGVTGSIRVLSKNASGNATVANPIQRSTLVRFTGGVGEGGRVELRLTVSDSPFVTFSTQFDLNGDGRLEEAAAALFVVVEGRLVSAPTAEIQLRSNNSANALPFQSGRTLLCPQNFRSVRECRSL